MKIIFCKWKSICEVGIANAMKRLGNDVVSLDYRDKNFDYDYDKEYAKKLIELCHANPDARCVFSVNFLPIIARACKVEDIKYLSWTVDCPSFRLYSKTIAYPTNRIFLLDRMQFEKFLPANPDNIFHLPMGTDVAGWDKVQVSAQDQERFGCDISFVGSLYAEKAVYNKIEKNLPDYIRGYSEGLLAAQQNVYGYNFLEDAITDEWAEEFKKYAQWEELGEDYIEDMRGIVADVFLGEKCTELERISTFKAISEHFNMDLWTQSDTQALPYVHNRGIADSDTMMPKIIKCSRINLNLTNRPIKSGLPLRIFDLMACGGFVISNYQPEIPELFVPGEDIVLYDSISDLLSKIEYYLAHDDERKTIAKSGYEKVKKYHSYDERLKLMFEVCGLQ
jgi:spore maturation protein CgeB